MSLPCVKHILFNVDKHLHLVLPPGFWVHLLIILAHQVILRKGRHSQPFTEVFVLLITASYILFYSQPVSEGRRVFHHEEIFI